jgi:hypothetical protein
LNTSTAGPTAAKDFKEKMEQLGTPTTAGLSKPVETSIAEEILTTVGTPGRLKAES